MSNLHKAVISAISYFDIFDYPLTLVEIWKWLFVGFKDQEQDMEAIDLSQLQTELDTSSELLQKLETKNGFYYLKGREDIINKRLDKYRFAEKKYNKARKIVSLLRFVPWVKMIAICNTLAYNNSRLESDIDLFIVAKRRRVWQVRWWVTGFLKLFNLRPRPGRTQDTLCPSFFVDEDNLDLRPLAIEKDIYLIYWAAQLFPVYDENMYQSFIDQNSWLKENLPNWQPIVPSPRRQLKRIRIVKSLLNFIGFFLPENLFKKQQMKIMPARLKQMANQDTRVVINGNILKFHDNDRRDFFLKSWEEKLAKIL